ncbi:hypothetical protein, partial [Raoultella ornithinolytica]|uniref:hypothetical protein n=1 Tax=Raoultella ornithinolytica TaxID=54291 RepID=UPI001F321469
YCVVINAHGFSFLLLLFSLYIMQHVLLSKINVKKGKIIHFCEIAFTFLENFNYQKVSTGETLVSVQETSVSTEET